MSVLLINNRTPQQLARIAARARQNFSATDQAALKPPPPAVAMVELEVPTTAGGTRILAYRSGNPAKPVPVLVNMHGGGFIMGSPEDDDAWCRQIADAVGCLVINIDYRLAPEHKFPTALEECYEVITWLCQQEQKLHIDSERIAVGGQSAGGNLAAGLCLLARERQEFMLACQVLNYPPLNMTLDPSKKISRDTILTARMQRLFNTCYFRTEADAENPLVSPLLADDHSRLPAALIIAAELDPLLPEAEQYANHLRAAGVRATCKVFTGCMHAFTHFGPEAAAREALGLVCEYLVRAFNNQNR